MIATPPAARPLPLCVDLDGTLVRTDTLLEQLVHTIHEQPAMLLKLPSALLSGRAHFKRTFSDLCPLDAATLPYQSDLVEFLHAQKRDGRALALVTASDARVAESVAAHVGVFDSVHGSDGHINLKGAAKARRLTDLYGPGGFAYAGDSRADLPVWRAAGERILVNTSRSLQAKVASEGGISHRFGGRPSRARALLREMRVYQWVKNLLVFAPMLLAHAVRRPGVVAAALMTFVAFSITASGVYVINDLLDLEADRRHPRKRRRPFASGDLPLWFGVLGPALIIAGLTLAWIGGSFATLITLLLYVIVTNGYSAYFKTRPLVDVFVLAALYTLRVLAGGVATRIEVSVWLLGFSLFAFLSLAFLKRASELRAAVTEVGVVGKRRGYAAGDAGMLQTMGLASAFSSVVLLLLYLNSDAASLQYHASTWLWLLAPLLLFAQCRLWLSASRGQMTDDPIVYAAKDWVSRLVIVCSAVVYLLASYGPPPSSLLFPAGTTP